VLIHGLPPFEISSISHGKEQNASYSVLFEDQSEKEKKAVDLIFKACKNFLIINE
jgi:hypothetical protein